MGCAGEVLLGCELRARCFGLFALLMSCLLCILWMLLCGCGMIEPVSAHGRLVRAQEDPPWEEGVT